MNKSKLLDGVKKQPAQLSHKQPLESHVTKLFQLLATKV